MGGPYRAVFNSEYQLKTSEVSQNLKANRKVKTFSKIPPLSAPLNVVR